MTIYLVWEEEMYEAPVLCGVYDNLAAAQECQRKLKARDRREHGFSHRSYDIDRVHVANECKRAMKFWPRKRVYGKPQRSQP